MYTLIRLCQDSLMISICACHMVGDVFTNRLGRYGLVISMSTSHVVGHGFVPQLGYTKDHHKNSTYCLSALHAWLSESPGSVWNCMGTCISYLGINHKCRVLYPGLRFLYSATWPSMLKKHSN